MLGASGPCPVATGLIWQLSLPLPRSCLSFPQTLLAREVVAVNQDPLGAQGRPVWPSGSGSEGGVEVWVKPLADGRTAVLLVNLGEETVDVTTEFAWVRGQGQHKWRGRLQGSCCTVALAYCLGTHLSVSRCFHSQVALPS